MHCLRALLACLYWVLAVQPVLANEDASRPPPDVRSSNPPSNVSRSSAGASGRETERALNFGHRGLSAAADEDWQTAYDLFAQAEQLAHSPVFLLYLARAAWRLGRWTEARRLLLECSGEQLDPHAPGPWRDAVKQARVSLQILELWIPRATLLFSTDTAFPVTVRISGETRIARDATPLVFHQDKGRHELRFIDARGQAQVLVWDARKGSRAEFVLAPAPDELASAGQPTLGPSRRSPGPLHRAALASLVSGGAALMVSGSSFAVALGIASGVKARCDGNQCQERERRPAGQAMRAGNLATAGLVVAGVGALGGVTFLLMARSHKPGALHLTWDLRGLRLSGEF